MNTVDLAVFYSYYGTCQARARRDSSMLLRSSKNFKGLFFLYAPSRNKDGGNCWVLFQQLAGFAHCFQRNLGTLDLVNQRHQISAAGLSEKKGATDIAIPRSFKMQLFRRCCLIVLTYTILVLIQQAQADRSVEELREEQMQLGCQLKYNTTLRAEFFNSIGNPKGIS